MQLVIGDDIRIVWGDGRNYVVERRKQKKDGSTSWAVVGYYGSIVGAANRCLDLRMDASEAESFDYLLKEIKDARKEIAQACRGLGQEPAGVSE